jgi:flagellar hook-length control protein FliK
VLQVASDPKIHVQSHTLPRDPRPAQQLDRAPSPFESLLDDGAQAADQSVPLPADDKASRADGSQPARTPPTNSSDSTTAAADDNDVATKPCDDANLDKTEIDGNAASDNKAGLNAKVIECAAAGDSVNPAGDDKSADGHEADNQTVAAPVGSIQTITGADAIAAVPTSAPESGQDEPFPQLPEQAAPAAQVATQLKPLDRELVKAVVGKQADAAKQSDSGKKVGEQFEIGQSSDEIVDDPNLTPQITPPAHAYGKSQPATNDSDKQLVAQARGEAPAGGGHPGTDAPALPAGADVTVQKGIPDTTPPVIVSTQSHAASSAAPATLVLQTGAQPAAVPLAGLAVEIAGKALAGKNRFEIRLDPPELGRIEVRLDVDRDGNVTSRLTVERADTLDLLRRDAASLERALQDAGLKTTDNGLQFSLRDQTTNQQQAGSSSDTAQLVVQDETQPPIDVIPRNYGRLAGQGGGLDIRV